MLHKVLFILTLSTICMCQNSVKYCVVDSGSNGTMLDDGEGKDSATIFSTSKFLDNTTITINFTTNSEWKHFQVYSSFNDTNLDKIILDKRWESLINEHDDSTEIQNLLNSATDFYASIKKNRSEGFQWYHFKKKGIDLYSCEEYASSCSKKIETESPYKYYDDNSGHRIIWKIHNYTFLFTDKDNVTERIYESLDKCELIKRGCLSMYLVACPNCELVLELYTSEKVKNETLENKTKTEENHNQNYTLHYQGKGEWETIQLNLTDFNSCIVIKAHTQGHIYNDAQKKLWAIGDIAYLSKTLDCQENKRYLEVNTTEEPNVVCESSTNQRINLTSELPNPRKQKMVYQPTTPPEHDSSSNWIVIIIVVAVVCVLLLVGSAIYVIIVRKRKNTKLSKTLYSKINNEEAVKILPTNSKQFPKKEKNWKPIKSTEFSSYVREMLDPNRTTDFLEIQFNALPNGDLKPCENGQKPENGEKNRFLGIYPYDENRVKLEQLHDEKMYTTDYINASYVEGVNSAREYIITQNPRKCTVNDFWRMIWEQEVDHIVMITSPKEESERYWPKLGTSHNYSGINVYASKVQYYEFYNHLVLQCSRFGQNREIHHLHFYAWSEEIVSPHVFLDFIHYLLKIPHRSAPIVFHCLAGLGRSATLLLCDIALRTVAISGDFDLFQTTKRLRECRANMIRNLKQYQLAHLIVSESFSFKDCGIDINEDFPVHFTKMLEGNIIKKIWSEQLEKKEWLYEALTRYHPCTMFPNRNRYQDDSLLPVEHSRVPLQFKQPDYVNAMFVNDFKQVKNFIVAQQPSNNTLHDFWLMVLQNRVKIVVNLNELDVTNRSDCCYFPTSEKSILKISDSISVLFDGQEELLNYDRIAIKLFTRNTLHASITLISVRNWPKIKSVPDSTDLMINIWDITRKDTPQNVPILICCDDGIRASSLVVCFFYMVDKMLQENKCDIVSAVKAIRRTHLKFINFEQFVFLYHCALTFYKNCYHQCKI